MTVDALFLYYLLCSLKIEESDGIVTKFNLQDSILTGKQGIPLVNAAGLELTKDAIVRDVFMIENQIPTDILKQILTVIIGIQFEERHVDVDKYVGSKMLDFCRVLCPLHKIEQLPSKSEPVKCDHLLDLMYNLVVSEAKPELEHEPVTKPELEHESLAMPELEQELVTVHELHEPATMPHQPEPQPEVEPKDNQAHSDDDKDDHRCTCSLFHLICWLCCSECSFYCIFADIYSLLLLFIYAAVFIVLFILGLAFLALTYSFSLLVYLFNLLIYLVGLSYPVVESLHDFLTNSDIPFLKPFTNLLGQVKRTSELCQQESPNSDTDARPAVTIPSVTQLHKAGIHFQPAQGGVAFIKFDEGSRNFYLPKIRVDVNSEVIIRNLVAYESLTKSNRLIFTRYVELMRALIDTTEDVKLLVHEKIIETELSDEQVEQLFNGMTKSIRPTNTPKMEEVIKKVNAEFDSTNDQKLHRFMTKYVYPSGRFLTVLAGLALLALTALQTYCSLYGCSHASKFGNRPEYGVDYRNNYFKSSM